MLDQPVLALDLPTDPSPGGQGEADVAVVRRQSGVLARFLRSPKGAFSSVLLLVLVVVGVFAPLLAPYDPIRVVGPILAPPSGKFLLGTDNIGRDVLSLLIYGARSSLEVGLLATAISIGVGTLIGATAGYLGGFVDGLLMRVTELVQIVPAIVIAIVVAALFRADLMMIILIIGFTTWTSEARVIRAQFLTLRERDFVAVARVTGYSRTRIVFSEILPNAFPPMLVQGAMSVGEAILAQAILAYLGVGDLNDPSWGQMINAAQPYLEIDPLISVVPGLAILLVVITFTLASDALNDAFNPRGVKFRALIRRSNRVVAGIRRRRVGPAATLSPAPELTGDGVALDARDVRLRLATPGGIVTAVDGVSVRVDRGEIVGIVGESGSGKSSLARVAANLLPIAEIDTLEGSVRIGDLDSGVLAGADLRRARRGHVAMIFQEPLSFLNPTMTVGRQIAEAVPDNVAASQRREVVAQLLQRVELDPALARRYPHELSGGQRQRMMIAIALASRPVLLIADEPTAALDATVQQSILQLLRRLQEEIQFGLLFITHDLAIVASLCDRVYVMRQGIVVESGATAEVFTRPDHVYTRHLLASRPGARQLEEEVTHA
jgi:peptide/nickel transport system permease protein